MPVEHYENFPVASFFLPAHLRKAVAVIYKFARTADDFADEGDWPDEQRINALTHYEHELKKMSEGTSGALPLFVDLARVVEEYELPLTPFFDLLSAFKQDIKVKRYLTDEHLLDYCKRSANPVGLIMLYLYRSTSTITIQQSDAICTALQLINFCQDVAIDWQKQRIYIPLDELNRFDIGERDLSEWKFSSQWRALMLYQTGRAKKLLISGSPLAKRLPGRVGWELRLVIQGGLRVIELIDSVQGDVFHQRPMLEKKDYVLMLWRAIWM